jgi:pilus assembly protein CpaE
LQAGVREVVPSGDPSFVVDAIRRAVAVPVSTPAQPTLVDELMRPAQAQVAVALEEAPPEVAQQQRAGQVITVFSPKGGSGKTTISTNLAVALSRLAPPVCLIDLDLEFGDVAISLRLAPNRTLADAVKLEVEGDEDEALQMLTTDYSDGLKCILAPIEPGDAEKIPSELITDLIALLRPRYSYIVIDTPSQLSPHVLAALDASDHHVLLTNPEIPSLKNLRLTLDMLDLLHYPRERRSVIFNRADAAAGLSAEEVESTIKTSLTASVPASRDVPASINRGVPIVAAKPDHAVSTAIINFAAERIVGVAPAGRARSRRLFRRKPA